MVTDFKSKYFYKNIKDFLLNHVGADRLFYKLTKTYPKKLKIEQMIGRLGASTEMEAIKIILEEFMEPYLVIRDTNKKYQIILLDLPEIMPLNYYKDPETLKKIRIEMGCTQKNFGWKMGFESKRRSHTIWEKEQEKAPITDRDARLLRYLEIYGDIN